MDTEIGLIPLFQSTIQTMFRSVLFKHAVVNSTPLNTMHAGISVSLAVLNYKGNETSRQFCRNSHEVVSANTLF